MDRAALKNDVFWLGVAVGVIGLAALLHPSTEVVTFYGHAVPGLCPFRALTGIPCPGCGLTRSFTFLAHGDLAMGFHMNPFGPVFFGVLAAQIPYRLLRIVRARREAVPDGPARG